MEDGKIIELFFARDEQAIRATNEQYGKLCRYIAGRILSDRSDAEECVNDAYLTVWNTIPPTRPAYFKAFLCKITRNLALKKAETAGAQKRTAAAMLSLEELEEAVPDRTLSSVIGEEELGKAISAFLRKQSEDRRSVFLRRYWFFDSISEIAERCGFSESKVKSMLFHTRNKLREYLKKEGFEL